MKTFSGTEVCDIFERHEPGGDRNLANALKIALADFFHQEDDRPGRFLIILNGVPDDQAAVLKVVADAAGLMEYRQQIIFHPNGEGC